MAQQFVGTDPVKPTGTPGGVGVVQLVSFSGSVDLQASVDGTNWTSIDTFTVPAVKAVTLAPQMRIVQTGGSDAVVKLEG